MRLRRPFTSIFPHKLDSATGGAENLSNKSSSLKQFSKKRILIVSGIAIATTLGIVGYRWWSYTATHESTDDAYVTGYIHPVSSRIAGTVVQVDVNDNQDVQKGQLLIGLDPKDYQVVVQQAQAALENARQQASAAQATINLASQTAQANTTEAQGAVGEAIASIASSQAAVNQAQAAIIAAQDQLTKTQAQEANVKITYQRYEQLYQAGAIPQQQRDDALTAYQVAQAETQSAQQGIVEAKAKYQSAIDGIDQSRANLVDSQGKVQQAKASGQQTEVNRSQFEAAQAQIATAVAHLKQAQLNLSYTLIKAPVAGRIGNKTVQVGQRIQPDQPLLSVVSDDSWIIANFNETQVSKMQPGESVDIHMDAFPGQTFKGVVNSQSPASGSDFSLLPPDNATGNFTKVVQRIPVKITFDRNSIQAYESRITPGMSVEVTVNTGND
ncbi:HlyD family secretion protein [Leptolyngbya sp. FACHB-16]|uniref:HlyD family secretion protein n=1 Tax=unclassified Leptolyngbya TaxID=2650499 RepID=UPI0016851273|nr:HlyD family secretion protein [Leptolyngbya sp. FACHB-16]MBD2157264.1 HlyD family secretion protein [Leptolyngbya sp. FACHB-16]